MQRQKEREKPPVLGKPPPLPNDDGGKDPLVGVLLGGKYRIGARLAVGAMGKIYRATQEPLHRVVAVKILSPSYAGKLDPNFEKRFYLEASEAAALKHPNTVTIHDFGRTKRGLFYIVMELVEGKTLAALVRERGRLDPLRAVRIVSKIARSLREAHNRGVVHRDLKPENIMVTQFEDDPDWVTVLDFGLVKVFRPEPGRHDEELTNPNLVMGSPRYMSPEQARNKDIGPGSDVYSLGIIAFLALTGTVPFGRKRDTPAIDIIDSHLKKKAPKITDVRKDLKVPKELTALVAKCLEKHPLDRFRDMDELLDALEEVERILVAGHMGRISRTMIDAGGGRWLGALMFLALILLVASFGIAGYLIFGGNGSEIMSFHTRFENAYPHSAAHAEMMRGEHGMDPNKAGIASSGKDLSATVGKQTGKNSRASGSFRVLTGAGDSVQPSVISRKGKACTIVMTSTPSDAEVYEKGRLLGKTPLTLTRKFQRGMGRTFNFWLSGHEPATVKLNAKRECIEGEPVLLHANLAKLEPGKKMDIWKSTSNHEPEIRGNRILRKGEKEEPDIESSLLKNAGKPVISIETVTSPISKEGWTGKDRKVDAGGMTTARNAEEKAVAREKKKDSLKEEKKKEKPAPKIQAAKDGENLGKDDNRKENAQEKNERKSNMKPKQKKDEDLE
ncbi:MAG: protein kinase [Deltaproteobacteria bacterium]|nr:protein kinase [Deltaproteobacteria bacterium]